MNDAAYYTGPNDRQIESIWFVMDDYSVSDAVALSAGYNPKVIQNCLNDTYFENRFSNYTVMKKLIISAIQKGRLPAVLVYDKNPNVRYVTDKNAFVDAVAKGLPHDALVSSERAEPNWDESIISQDDLKSFLSAKGLNFPFNGEIDFDTALHQQVEQLSIKLVAAHEKIDELQKLNGAMLLGDNLRIAMTIQHKIWGEWILNPKSPIPAQDYIKSLIKEKYPDLNETLVTSIDRVIAPFDRSKSKVDEAKAAFLAKHKAL